VSKEKQVALDFHWIVPGIAQGSFPQPLSEAFKHADTIVFCAMEKQPKSAKAPAGKRIIRFGFDDDIYRPIPPEVGDLFHQMARRLAGEVTAGRKLLITCAMGLNRSGIITGLTMMYALRMAPHDVIKLIRARRSKDALMNPIFEQWLLNQRRG
jgi:protein-tyrosine phosphatase